MSHSFGSDGVAGERLVPSSRRVDASNNVYGVADPLHHCCEHQISEDNVLHMPKEDEQQVSQHQKCPSDIQVEPQSDSDNLSPKKKLANGYATATERRSLSDSEQFQAFERPPPMSHHLNDPYWRTDNSGASATYLTINDQLTKHTESNSPSPTDHGKCWERGLVCFIFLSSLFAIVLALTDPFIAWFPSARKYLTPDTPVVSSLPIDKQGLTITHIVASSLMFLCLPVLVTPYFYFGTSKNSKPAPIMCGMTYYKGAFWVYIVASLPAISTAFILGGNAEPKDFATISAFMVTSFGWAISLPFMVYYLVVRADTVEYFRWLLRQFGLCYIFHVVKSLILEPVLIGALHSPEETYPALHGASVWLSALISIVLTEYFIIPAYLSRYVYKRITDDRHQESLMR